MAIVNHNADDALIFIGLKQYEPRRQDRPYHHVMRRYLNALFDGWRLIIIMLTAEARSPRRPKNGWARATADTSSRYH